MSRLYNTKNKNPIVIKSIAPTLGTKKTEEFKKNLKNKSRVKKMGGGMMGRRMGYQSGMSVKGDNKRDIRKTESMTGASKSSKREKGLVGNQKKIDVAAPFGTINEKDFKKLRSKKT
jgi:hypothetical protein